MRVIVHEGSLRLRLPIPLRLASLAVNLVPEAALCQNAGIGSRALSGTAHKGVF